MNTILKFNTSNYKLKNKKLKDRNFLVFIVV